MSRYRRCCTPRLAVVPGCDCQADTPAEPHVKTCASSRRRRYPCNEGRRRSAAFSSSVTTQPLVQRLLIASLAALAALVSAYAAISPSGHLVTLLYLLIALTLALGAPPHSFIAVSVLVFAVSTSTDTPVLGVLSIPVYLSNFMVLLIAARAAFRMTASPRTGSFQVSRRCCSHSGCWSWPSQPSVP